MPDKNAGTCHKFTYGRKSYKAGSRSNVVGTFWSDYDCSGYSWIIYRAEWASSIPHVGEANSFSYR